MRQKILKAYTPTEASRNKWLASVTGAETVGAASSELKMEKMIIINNEITSESAVRKKRKLSGYPDIMDEMNNKTMDNKKIKMENMEPGESEDSVVRGATRRQRDVIHQREERERRDKEKGPAWTYELVPVSSLAPSPAPVPVFGQFVSGRACVK